MMKIRVIAMGTKMPSWVQAGCAEYLKRLPKDFAVELKELPLVQRSKNQSSESVIAAESEKVLAAVPTGYQRIVLDKDGLSWSTEALAAQIAKWQMQGQSLAILIGGPDGFSPDCVNQAHTVWSLSALTLPHPLVRIVLFEQLYRAWSLLNNHPYHK